MCLHVLGGVHADGDKWRVFSWAEESRFTECFTIFVFIANILNSQSGIADKEWSSCFGGW
jgi:hypothetical protein